MRYEATIEDPKVFTQEGNSELFEYQYNAYLLEQEWNNPASTFFEQR